MCSDVPIAHTRIIVLMLGVFSLLISLGGLLAVHAQSVQVFATLEGFNGHKCDRTVTLFSNLGRRSRSRLWLTSTGTAIRRKSTLFKSCDVKLRRTGLRRSGPRQLQASSPKQNIRAKTESFEASVRCRQFLRVGFNGKRLESWNQSR